MTKSIVIKAKTEEKLKEMIERAVGEGARIQCIRHVKGAKLPFIAEGYREVSP